MRKTIDDGWAIRNICLVPNGTQRGAVVQWLEYLPVTQGVAGSSPVRSANSPHENEVQRTARFLILRFLHLNPAISSVYDFVML